MGYQEKCSMNIGVIGCGKISDAYFKGAMECKNLKITACADLNMEAARAKAQTYQIKALSVEEILAESDIGLIVNLTIPKAHVPVGLQVLEAGKHLYLEKPIGVHFEEGGRLIEMAGCKGLKVGCAPDTFLFGGSQTARKKIDDGTIGEVASGTAFMMCHGHESWHPSPAFYYDIGGGPLYDMGPYYITALVNFLGPAKSVVAHTSRAYSERIATAKEIEGRKFPVKIDTHVAGVIEFWAGAAITVIMSFDTWNFTDNGIVLTGTEGALNAGDPNHFKSPVKIYHRTANEWIDAENSHPHQARMIGVSDMVEGIKNRRPIRASGELALHVLEVMDAFYMSAEKGCRVNICTKPGKPMAMPAGLGEWEIVD